MMVPIQQKPLRTISAPDTPLLTCSWGGNIYGDMSIMEPGLAEWEITEVQVRSGRSQGCDRMSFTNVVLSEREGAQRPVPDSKPDYSLPR
jgi:hypothetical protein